MNSPQVIAFITAKLQALNPVYLQISDESDDHIGHREAGNGLHLRVEINSPQFANLTTLKKHRLVYNAIGPLNAIGVHALAINITHH